MAGGYKFLIAGLASLMILTLLYTAQPLVKGTSSIPDHSVFSSSTQEQEQQDTTALPPPRPLRQKLKDANIPLERVIMIASNNEDTSWIPIYLGDIPTVVYAKDNPDAVFNVPGNKGKEATSYLKYIVDNYDALPDHTAFLHAHRSSWHSPDIVPLIRNLNWNTAPFFNLAQHTLNNTIYMNLTGTPDRPAPPAEGKEDMLVDNGHIKKFWSECLEGEMGPVPPWIVDQCCAQFVVTRDQILERPLNFYMGIFNWLQAGKMDDYWSSRVLEHTWHAIFGRPATDTFRTWCEITEGRLPDCPR